MLALYAQQFISDLERGKLPPVDHVSNMLL